MKTTKLLLLMLLLSLRCYSQGGIDTDCHRPMFVQGKSWNYDLVRVNGDGDSRIKRYKVQYVIDGDTLIDGLTYWKLYRDDSFTGKRTFNSAWRQEGEKVISTAWQVNADDVSMQYRFLQMYKFLLPEVYDFSDSPQRHYYYALGDDNYIQQDMEFRIDTVLVGGRLYRRFSEEWGQMPEMAKLRWIEGIGSNGGIYSPWTMNTALDGYEYEEFKSCSENGEIIFTLSDFRAQPYNPDGVQSVSHFHSTPLSPTNVYDLQGRRLTNSKWSNGQMPKGVYIRDGRKVVVK